MEKSELRRKRGKIIINREWILTMPQNELKCIFESFYPIAIDFDHSSNYYNSLVYHGVSQLFDELEEGEVAPEYKITLTSYEDGRVTLNSFKRVGN